MTSLTTKNVFLAIPFFVVSGAIMSAGSIARRLVAVAEALVGGMRGGLAVAALLASVIFAALSGSSPVTLIAIGGILFPAMLKAGYREPFALGLVTTAGSLGCLVPPSIPMLVYAISVTGTSAVDVRELFLAGMGAALVITLMLAVYAVLRAGPVQRQRARSRWPRLRRGAARGGLVAGAAGADPGRHLRRPVHPHRGLGGQRGLRGGHRGADPPLAHASASCRTWW